MMTKWRTPMRMLCGNNLRRKDKFLYGQSSPSIVCGPKPEMEMGNHPSASYSVGKPARGVESPPVHNQKFEQMQRDALLNFNVRDMSRITIGKFPGSTYFQIRGGGGWWFRFVRVGRLHVIGTPLLDFFFVPSWLLYEKIYRRKISNNRIKPT